MSPWDPAAGLASGLAAQAWQAAMLGLWNAGLWLLSLVLRLEDALLTPDLSADGPAAGAYGLTLWMAAALGTVMLLAQLLVTLLRHDARSLGAALLGCGKFVVVWAGWVGWATAVVGACGGLTRAVLSSLLHVSAWSGWQPGLRVSAEQAVDVTVATVLGLLGLVLWLAALGHVFVMLGRAVALLVLAATTPIAAAGLVGELGRAWFWRSVRWFHAAALTPPLMALLLGIGVQVSSGVTAGLADGAAKAVGTALPGVLLVATSCFAPLALFRLLSFVEPNTPAGESFRHTLAAVLQTGLMLGAPGRWPGTGSSTTTDGSASADDARSDPTGSGSTGSAASSRRDDAERSLHTQTDTPTATADASAGDQSRSGSTTLSVPAAPPGPSDHPGQGAVTRQLGALSAGAESQSAEQSAQPPAAGEPGGPAAGGSAAMAGEAGAVPIVPA